MTLNTSTHHTSISQTLAPPKTFMDFCAGIGGGRLGMTRQGFKCLAYSELDDHPAYTYQVMHGTTETNVGDLMQLTPESLPDFSVMVGGFPCQSFSIAGKRAGFEDHRGLIIYGLCRILEAKQVPYFILENVKGLVNHQQGQTMRIILKELTRLGYWVQYAVLDSSAYGVPQMRERVYLIGMKHGYYKRLFQWPTPQPLPTLERFLDPENLNELPVSHPTFQKYLQNRYNHGRFHLDELLAENGLILDTRQSDLRLYRGKCPTLRTGRHGILYVKDGTLRKLSALEALQLQGFPLALAKKACQASIPESKLLAQAGNAMTVNVIEALAQSLLQCC
ncbi:MAG: DNA (cytosine-5-)-methyltransferase [Vampirovibrionales bacterium]